MRKEAFQGAPRGSLLDVLPSSVRRLVAVGGSVASLSLLLAACATEARGNGNDHVPISEPVPATSTIDTTPPTEVPPQPVIVQNSPTPEVTPTVNVDALPVSEVARMLAEGKVSYQELQHWNNEQRREFGIAMAEYVNTEVAGDKAYVDMHFPEIGDTKIAWSPDYGWWRSSHNTPESQLDLTGESFSPLFIAGYTNTEGQEVFINPQGQEVVVPKINMPGELGEVSITDLYTMDPNQLKNYVIDTMLGANGMADESREYVRAREYNHFPLPIIIYENVSQNEQIYSYQVSTGSPSAQIPEARALFFAWKTNSVLMPVLDPGSNQLIGWVSIQQGFRDDGMKAFIFAPGENPTVFNASRIRDPNAFGDNPNHFFGIVLLGKTTKDTYSTIYSEDSFLEDAPNIGGETEIQRIMNAKNTVEIMQILTDLRFFATSPGLYLFPTKK